MATIYDIIKGIGQAAANAYDGAHDERFSSDVIFKELRKNHNSISKIKKKLDQQAAAYILQGFLDSSKKN